MVAKELNLNPPQSAALEHLQAAILRLNDKPLKREGALDRAALSANVETALDAYRSYMKSLQPQKH